MPRSRRASSRAARAARTSPIVATIGNMTLTGCSAAVRSTARSCADEQVGPRELQPDAAAPQERVGLGLLGQRAQRLVGADVERADDERAPAEPARDGRVGLGLLVLVGQLVAVEEQELRPQQPDALGALLDGRRCAVDVAQVREHVDAPRRPASRRARRRARARRRGARRRRRTAPGGARRPPGRGRRGRFPRPRRAGAACPPARPAATGPARRRSARRASGR